MSIRGSIKLSKNQISNLRIASIKQIFLTFGLYHIDKTQFNLLFFTTLHLLERIKMKKALYINIGGEGHLNPTLRLVHNLIEREDNSV